MNLLIDPWIPVRSAQTPEISLETLLCQDNPGLELSFHRDDMELAALQLAICLAQVIFPPADRCELRERKNTPMMPEAYRAGIQPFIEMFDLRHPTQPFMQTRGVEAKEFTPIQKLFAGLPEGQNHALFNDTGEIAVVPASWAAIALFNQAVNCPSFGGGFKGSLRGEAPVSTFIKGNSLRETVWLNVLNREFLTEKLPHLENIKQDLPVWVAPITAKSSFQTYTIGLLRGLFWQPTRVELLWNESGECIGFNKEKFVFDVGGFWIHPHSPHIVNPKQDKRYYLSFRNVAPAWTYLIQMLIENISGKQGHVPALVTTQYRQMFPGEKLNLIAGGYKNKQASIIQRRHELVSLASGWDENMGNLAELISFALDIKNRLTWALQQFSKSANVPKLNLADIAEQRFYLDSEDFIYSHLRRIEWNEITTEKQRFFDELSGLARRLFAEGTQSYQNLTEPKLVRALAESERLLSGALYNLNPTPKVKETEPA